MSTRRCANSATVLETESNGVAEWIYMFGHAIAFTRDQ